MNTVSLFYSARKQEGSRPVIQSKFQDTSFKVGDKIVLEATVVGQPTPTVEWLKNNKKVRSSRNLVLSHDNTLHRLTINKASEDDGGEYKIVAKNKIASTSFSADISIEKAGSKPVFVKELENIEVMDMEPVKFEVEVKNCDSVKWYVDEEEISDDEDFEFKEDGDVFSFRIASINPEDEGTYGVKATNEYGVSTSACTLTVNELEGQEIDVEDGGDVETPTEEPVIEMELKDECVEVTEGETFTTTFTVSGKPSPEVNFYKDDDVLDANEHIEIINRGGEHTFKIRDLTEEDSGFYLIEAESDSGFVEKEFELVVTGMDV